MASGKSLEKPKPHTVKLYHNNGQPLHRKRPKERMSKKERLRQRREEKEINARLNEQMRGNTEQGGGEGRVNL
jgi:hypothetical protein